MLDTQQEWQRGFVGSIVDRIFAWKFGMPPERCGYKVRAVRIPVSDGLTRIELAADLFQPLQNTKPLGTLLVRGPYGRGMPAVLPARALAARGYQVLNVSCRGTFGSGGDFDPFRDEVEDGKAVVQWMREQDWYTGSFATVGPSYLGFTQWALLCDPPEDMVAAIISVGPHDASRLPWENRALSLDIVAWGLAIAHQEEPYFALKQLWNRRHFRRTLDSIPLVQEVETAIQNKVPWLSSVMTIPDMDDPYYTPMKLGQALERADIPIFLISGWYDCFVEQSMEQYIHLQERGCPVAMTMGPWTHIESLFNGLGLVQSFAWLEEHLAKRGRADRQAPLQYYVTGAEEWRYAARFLPPTNPHTLYLQSGRRLDSEVPEIEAKRYQFSFDPRNPTPTVGGNLLSEAGSLDDTKLCDRSDVLTFTSDPLSGDLEMIGKPTVELNHSTDNSYADLFIRISEVDANAKSRNITEMYRRLDPERKEGFVHMPLHWIAHVFKRGKRIRLVIAGGSHPHYARNIGTSNLDNRGSKMVTVKHTVFYGGLEPSKVVLPITLHE